MKNLAPIFIAKSLIKEFRWEIGEYIWFSVWLSGFLALDHWPIWEWITTGFGGLLVIYLFFYYSRMLVNWANDKLDRAIVEDINS